MKIQDAQVVVLAENQYQELELWYPLLRLREEGANVVVVGPAAEQVYASKLGYPVKPDVSIADVDAADFDGVVIPGGFAPEGMRRGDLTDGGQRVLRLANRVVHFPDRDTRALERGRQLMARTAPVGPEVHDDRALSRTPDHIALERGRVDIHDRRVPRGRTPPWQPEA